MVQISCTSWYEMQILVFAIASIVLMRIGDVKLRELNLKKSKLVEGLPSDNVTVNLIERVM